MSQIPAQQLSQLDLFQGLSNEEIQSLAKICSEFSFNAGQTILQEGEKLRALWILLEGAAQVELEVPSVGEKLVAELHAPSIFGETSFFHAAPHSATVKSVAASRVLRLDRAGFELLASQQPTAALRISIKAAEILAARLQQTNRWVEQMLSQQADAKVHEAWKTFRERMGHHFSAPTSFVGIGAGWE